MDFRSMIHQQNLSEGAQIMNQDIDDHEPGISKILPCPADKRSGI